MGMHPELAEYRKYEEEIRDTLETQYQMALFNKDLEGAYNTLGKLMEYKLIDMDDPRIEKNNKSFKAAGISKDHRFKYDYRKDTSYIPGWLYGNIDQSRMCVCDTLEHWGKRVEGNYEGDTTFTSFQMPLRVKLCTTPKQVQNVFERVSNLMSKEKRRIDINTLQELSLAGVYRVYDIEVQGNCLNNFRTIGYAIVKIGNNGAMVYLILRNEAIVGNWLPVERTIQNLKQTINKAVNGAEFKLAFDPAPAVREQNGLIAHSKNISESRDKLLKQQVK